MESHEEEQEIAALVLVKQIARMTRYKPNDTNDYQDALDTLNSLIQQARKIVNL